MEQKPPSRKIQRKSRLALGWHLLSVKVRVHFPTQQFETQQHGFHRERALNEQFVNAQSSDRPEVDY